MQKVLCVLLLLLFLTGCVQVKGLHAPPIPVVKIGQEEVNVKKGGYEWKNSNLVGSGNMVVADEPPFEHILDTIIPTMKIHPNDSKQGYIHFDMAPNSYRIQSYHNLEAHGVEMNEERTTFTLPTQPGIHHYKLTAYFDQGYTNYYFAIEILNE